MFAHAAGLRASNTGSYISGVTLGEEDSIALTLGNAVNQPLVGKVIPFRVG
jgi:hypothetical protein